MLPYMSSPSSAFPRQLMRHHGYRFIAGVDEVGCGCLAGPVVAAAVLLPSSARLPGLHDSKLVSTTARAVLAKRIQRLAVWAIGVSSVEEIDTLGIRPATLLASKRALLGLSHQPDAVVSDAFFIPDLPFPCHPLVRADQRVRAVAAASIVAKVHRDLLMSELAHTYPRHGFEIHKGYGTARHLTALADYGVTPQHRRSFAPVKQQLEKSTRE